MKKAGASPPMAKFVRKVKAHTEAKATCFLYLGHRRGSLGSLCDGVGTKIIVEEDVSALVCGC